MKDRQLLAQSQNYRISHEFEVVFLESLVSSGAPIVIGDFYGDPEAAIIDQDERFAIMVGCGMIIYQLCEPFEPFCSGIQSPQWKEMFRGPDATWWIESIVQQNTNSFQFIVDPHSIHGEHTAFRCLVGRSRKCRRSRMARSFNLKKLREHRNIGVNKVEMHHVAEAINYRAFDRKLFG